MTMMMKSGSPMMRVRNPNAGLALKARMVYTKAASTVMINIRT